MATDDFWIALGEHSQNAHKERVAKTPERVEFAKRLLEEHGIEYVVKNYEIGHIHAYRKRDGKLFQFRCGTGKILGENDKRGIHCLIKILEE